MSLSPIRVLIVDDSRSIRQVFRQFLSEDLAIEVVGEAEDPYDAREKIKQLNPDVITLDIEMPKMDGISFLEKIMTLRPMPVVMASTLTERGAEHTLRALELGAVDYVAKPKVFSAIGSVREELVHKVKMAASAKLNARRTNTQKNTLSFKGDANYALIAIGASTGGVEAIRELLVPLPDTLPPIVITQHMPSAFTTAFAKRLNGLTQLRVVELDAKQELLAGHAYIAQGSTHMQFVQQGKKLFAYPEDSPAVSGHKPSVDAMFHGLAEHCRRPIIAAILTGMGKDGASGLKALREKGAYTLAQSEPSCIVYGMPRAAKELDAVCNMIPLEAMAEAIVSKLDKLHLSSI